MSRDRYRDQIVTISVEIAVTECDVGVSPHSKKHPLFMYVVHLWHVRIATHMHTSVEACFLYFFYNPYMSLLIIIHLSK